MTINKSQRKPASLWQEKPWWCQPWSIVLTGIFIIALTQLWPNRIWFTVIIGLIVLLWWALFLVIAPAAYRDEIKNPELSQINPSE